MNETPWSNPEHDIIGDLRRAWALAQTRIRAIVRPESAEDLRARLDALGFATQVQVQASEFVPEGRAILVRLCQHDRPHAICFECNPIKFRAADYEWNHADLGPLQFRITDLT